MTRLLCNTNCFKLNEVKIASKAPHQSGRLPDSMLHCIFPDGWPSLSVAILTVNQMVSVSILSDPGALFLLKFIYQHIFAAIFNFKT